MNKIRTPFFLVIACRLRVHVFILFALFLFSAAANALDLTDYENSATVSTTESFDDDADNDTDTIQVFPQLPLTVNKVLLPAGDVGLFIMNANGTTGAEAGDGATASALVIVGEMASFSEAAGAGTDLANYSSSYNCVDENATVITSGSGTSGSFTMPTTPVSEVICTITNTRLSATLALEKVWVDALVGEEISATTTGLLNNATLTSDASAANETDTGAAVTVFAGEVATIPLEAFTVAANAANYASSDWVCDDSANTTVAGGGTLSITAADMGNAITCTVTNTRESATLALEKVWVDALVGEEISATTTGLLNNATLTSDASAANETDTGAAVTVFAGEVATIPLEAFTVAANAANYASSDWVCDDSANTTVAGGGTLSITAADMGNAITCTVTNTRESATLALEKVWVDALVGEEISATTTGLLNNATLTSDASAANETDTGAAVTVFAGEVATIPLEAFTVAANAANYASSDWVCDDSANTTVAGGGTLSITAADMGNAITCTVTNTRESATLALEKVWVDALVGEEISATTTGLLNNATLTSDASAANETDTGAAVTVFAGEVATIPLEAFTVAANAANYASSDWVCDDSANTTVAGGGTLSITAADMGNAITCTVTNTRESATLALEKVWVDALVGEEISATTTGLLNNATLTSDASAANETDTGAAVTVFAGEVATIPLEAFTVAANAANYASSDWVCDDSANTTVAGGGTLSITAADMGNAITCTVTNTRESATLALEKVWVDALVGEEISATTTGLLNNATLTSDASAANETDTGAAVTVFAGEVATIPLEAFTVAANAANYASSDWVCDDSANTTVAGGGTLSITAADMGNAITCTVTNTRESATLALEKVWVDALVGEEISATTTGLLNNATLTSDASAANETDTGAAVTVFAGEVATIPLEAFTVAANAANYASSDWVCDDSANTTVAGGGTLSITAADMGNAITCTVTNTRESATLALEKVWVDALVGEEISATTTGLLNNATLTSDASAANETDTGAAVTVFAGEVATIPLEAFTVAANAANYASSDWVCDDSANTTVAGGGTLSITAADMGNAITCTVTNTRESATLALEKVWVDALVGEEISATTTGLLNNATLTSDASAANETDTGAAVTVFAGEVATIPLEAFTVAANAANYASSDWVCDDSANTTVAGGGTLSITAADMGNAITCTVTNTRESATLALEKVWVDALVGEEISATTTGLLNNATLTSDASAANETDTGAAVTVFAGEVATIPLEAFTVAANAANYASSDWVCDDSANTTVAGGGTLSITAADMGNAITCTVTNTRESATLALEKVWVDALVGEEISATTTGLLNNATLTSDASAANETDTGAAVTVFAGEVATIPLEAFTVAANAANYASSDWVCDDSANTTVAGGGTLSITAADMGNAITCTVTNTRESATLALEKVWVDALVGEEISATTTGLLNNATLTSDASAANETDTGAAVTVFAGEVATIPLEAFTVAANAANYASSDWVCDDSANTTVAGGGTLSITAADMGNAITCTVTNTRESATLALEKVWVDALVGEEISATTTGLLNNATLTSDASAANETDTGAAVTVFAGEVATIPLEAFTVAANAANYASSDWVCDDSANTTVAGGGTLSITAADMGNAITCTVTNTRESATLALEKVWVDALVGEEISATTTGLLNNATLTSDASAANETDTGAAVTVFAGEVATIPLEAFTVAANAANYASSDWVCDDSANTTVAGGGTLSITAADMGNAITCTVTNTRESATLALEKVWVDALVGEEISATTTGLLNNATLTSDASAANETDTGAAVTVFAGEVATIPLEAFTVAANAANYASSDWVCDDSANTTVAGGGTLSITAADMGNAITCTVTNTRESATLALEKVWVDALVGEEISATTTGLLNNATLTSDASAANETDTGAAVTVFAGEVATIPLEAFTVAANAANYASSDWVCDDSANTTVAGGGTLSITAADMGNAITCTVTNTRESATLALEKVWVDALVGEEISATTTGLLNNATLTSDASAANETDTGAAVTVFAGEVATIPLEAFTVAANAANYASSDWVCDDSANTTVAGGGTLSITAADMGNAITCTVTNTRESATLALEKVWVDALVGEEISATTTGLLNNATLTSDASAANETDTGAAVTVFAGEVATIPLEAFTVAANAANYASSDWVCDDSANTTVAGGGTLSITAADMGNAITCTVTNTRESATLALEKVWVDALVGEEISATTTGLLNNATLTSDASAANETDTGAAVTVFAGEVATIPLEAFTVAANAANYASSDWVCDDSANTTVAGGGTLSITAADMGNAITCTVTNTRESATLALEKVWVDALVGEEISATTTGLLNNATLTSDASAANETDTGAAVTVFAGEVATIPLEAFTVAANAANYASSDWVCDDSANTTVAGGGTLSITAADMGNAITCTVTNTRESATLALEKVWVDALVGEEISATTTGLLNNATLTSDASAANETDTGAAVTVFAGEVATIPLEAFTVAANAANYASSDWVCDDSANTTVAGGGTLSITAADMGNAITCTVTNTRESATLALEKVWVDALVGEEISATTTGLLNNATLTSDASAANETDTGAAVTVFAGEVATIPLEAFTVAANAANYASSDWVCDDSANTTVAGGGTLSITAADMGNAITCTVTNTRGDRSFTAMKTQTSSKSPVDTAGDIITYDVVLFNDGLTSLSNPVVTDTLPDGTIIVLSGQVETGGMGTNGDGVLDIGETWTYMTSYLVSQDDINDGLDLVNAISAVTDETTADGDLPLTDTAITPVDGDPNFTVSKTQTSAKSPVDTAGDIITYDVVLFNDGMIDLNTPVVTDTLPDGTVIVLSGEVETGGPGINGDGILDVGETWTYTTSYTVTPDDLNLGLDLVNTVSAVTDETTADGDLPLEDTAVTPIQQLPSLMVDKSQTGGPNPATTIGDVLDYTITIENTGNITLTGVMVTDTLPDGTVGTLSAVTETLTADGVFEADEIWTYMISYTVTADDLTAGLDLVNTVSVITTEVPGPSVDTAITPVFLPSLIMAKSLAGTPVDLGGGVYRVTYNFVIENNGNVDMTNLQLEDDLTAMINTPNVNGATVANPVVSYVSGTVLTANPSYTGTGVNTLLSGTDVYPVGATTELSLAFDFTPDRYYGPFDNTAVVSGMDPLGGIEMDNSENAATPSAASPGVDIASPTPFNLDIVPTTPITLGWINITDNLNGSALIEWQTATEVANAGFNILVLNESGDWVQANASMISSQGDATSAQNYQFLSGIIGEQFMLVDVSVTGIQVQHGPFNLNESSGIYVTPKEIEWDQIQQESDTKQEQREQQRRQELQDRLSRTHNSHGLSKFMQSLAASLLSVMVPSAHAVDLVSFEVETAGLYQVTHQDLLATGLDLRGIDLSRLGLEEAGILWPMDKQASGGVFTSATKLLFPARGLDSLYSGVNKYTLVLDEGSLDIGTDSTDMPGNDVALAYSYLAEARYAPQNTYSYLSPESDDSWYADALNAISTPATKSVTLSVDGYVAPLSFGGGFGAQIQRQGTQNPQLEVSLWGGSALPGNGVTNPDHQVLLELNGESVADIRFDGLSLAADQTPLVSVREGNNIVDITVPNEQGYQYDLIRLDHVSLRYPRTFNAQANALVFESDWNKFRVSNLSSSSAQVVRLDADYNAFYMTERGAGDCTAGCVYFGGDSSASNSYFVATDAGLKTPEITAAVDGSNLATTPASFIIIAHPDFINTASQALEGYASEIGGQYGSVDLIDVETIYAAYSGGVVDAYAIKAYISDAYADRGTRHILLVGGDNYDYQDFTNSGAISFIPSIYQPISNNVKSVPSDSSYVLVDDDLAPDLTISRLPVRTTADLDNLIAKRQNYLARNYQNKVLMAADEVDTSNYSFKADVQELISDHFQSNSVNEVYLDDTTVALAKSQLISAFNGGVSFASYFGHSSTDRWSISSILSGDDVAGLSNAQSPTVVAQWGCWNTFYVSPEHDSMAHRFLLEGPQGAVTVMGASSFTEADAEKRMAEYLSSNLQQGMSIGDAVLDAKQQIYAETPYQIDVLLGWAVLGFDDMPVFD